MPPSFLEQLLALVEEDGPWRISFSDLAGLARRVPDLALPEEWKIHRCEFCVLAKSGATLRGCLNNKHAVNRVLIRRGVGFVGQCHLGLTDMVEPLMVKGRVLGAFYYGSVIVRGTEVEAERRIRRYAKRRGVPAEPFLEQMEKAARVDASEIEPRRARLRLVAQMAARLAEAWGVPLENDLPRRGGLPWITSMEFPVMLRRVMELVQCHYAEPMTLAGVAESLKVNADHLGRLFRQHTEGTLADFLGRVRVNHACRMLESGRYSVGEIALRVGFADAAHFGKVFKRLMQCTPGEYASRAAA
jgi:AraC-like DNA-binding protein